jgi:predicted deacylase
MNKYLGTLVIILIFVFLLNINIFGSNIDATVNFSYYNWDGFDTGANISEISEFKKFNVEGLLTQVLFDHVDSNGNFVKGLASNGTPIFKFNSSDGPTTIVIAGTHGNEYPPELAAFKLINTLNENKDKIKGIIYIIPMTNPKAVLNKSREYFGYDPNRVANNSSTFSGHIITEIVLKENISYVGDFHAMIWENPKLIYAAGDYPKSESIARYIANKTNSTYLISPNKGTITTTSAEHNLSSFTAEVENGNNSGIYSPDRADWSYDQMLAYLTYTTNYNENEPFIPLNRTNDNNLNTVSLLNTGFPLILLLMLSVIGSFYWRRKT